MTLPTLPPTAFEAGTTVAFTVPATETSLGTVSPAGGWGLTWHLRGVSEADVTATANTDTWTVTLTATASQALGAGGYTWALRGTLGVTPTQQVVTLSTGVLTVTPDMLEALAGDLQSWEEKTLAVVHAALDGTIAGEMKMYMIGGRQVMTFSLDELMALRTRLLYTIRAQRGQGFGTPIRFDVVGMR